MDPRALPDEPRDGASPRRAPLWLIPFCLLATLWAVAFVHYPRLPDMLPSAYGPGGLPLLWVPKGISFFALPLLATVAASVLSLAAALGAREPRLGGRPLTGPGATRVARYVGRYLLGMQCALLVFLVDVEFRGIQVAYGAREGLAWDCYLAGGALVGYALAGAVLLYRAARREQRRQETATAEA